MSVEACLELLAEMLRTTLLVAGPVLFASLVAGLAVGVLQTATQVNEPSISYLAKVIVVVAVLVAVGASLAQQATSYTRRSLQAIADVVPRS